MTYLDHFMLQVDDGYAMKNSAELSEEARKGYLHRLQSLFLAGNRLNDERRLLKGKAAEFLINQSKSKERYGKTLASFKSAWGAKS